VPIQIGFDTETRLITSSEPWPEVVCLTYAADGLKELIARADGQSLAETWEALISDPDLELVAHQSDYDLGVLSELRPSTIPQIFDAIDQGRIKDTKIREQLRAIEDGSFSRRRNLRNPGGFSLERMAQDYLGLPLDKGEDGWRLRYAELIGTRSEEWPERARDYAITDAVSTREIYRRQLASGYQPPDEGLQVAAQWALGLAKRRGVVTDGPTVDALELRLLEAQDARLAKLQEAGVVRADGSRDMAALRARIKAACEALGVDPVLTDGGKIATSEDALEPLFGVDPILDTNIDFAADTKTLGTFVPVMRRGVDATIHPGWNVLVESGRTSCSGESGNLQNIPRAAGARECLRARKGYALVAVDYAVAELRALAQICYSWFGRSALREAFVNGRDPHWELGAALLGLDYDGIQALKKTDPARAKSARQLAKIPNFGFPGGLGPKSLISFAKGYGVQLTLQRALELKAAWHSQWPEMRDYFNTIGLITADDGPRKIEQWGSRRVRGNVSYCEAANGYFQGLIADVAKRALYLVSRECYARRGPLEGSHPVLFIHDEVILEVPVGQIHEAAQRVEEIMKEVEAEWLPDLPPEAEAKASLVWSKDAERVVDAEGRLQIWTPKAGTK
jgi:hypothetical protein